jgi:hypothetical protein
LTQGFLLEIKLLINMDKNEFEKIINYIIEQGREALKNTDGKEAAIDYVAIFSKDDQEFNSLILITETLGEEIDKETAKTGKTFLLNEPMETSAGSLSLIKVRLPDATRPQRGAPDFKIQNYIQFKDKYLQSSGDFTLMIRKDYEMIEIKGVDVLVYIPNKTVSERTQEK